MSKVERVTLYKHGLGYFEVSREVEGAGQFQLNFRGEEMNDVLKSLTVHDPEGQVLSVSYDSQKSISDLLQEIALELPKAGGVGALLSRLQGAQVVVQVEGRTYQGAVVGLEARPTLSEGQVVQETWLTLWCQGQAMQNFRLSQLDSVEVCDESLRSDLSYALEVMFKANKRDSKQVTVITGGEGKRKLRLGYLVEAPAWKSSYRILLGADSSQPSHFEGWALIDNPRDEDWDDIELTLVAGLPISFRHDLYSPRYVVRQEIAVKSETLARPVQVSAAVPQAPRATAFAPALSADPFAAPAHADPFAAPADPFVTADPFGAPAELFAAAPAMDFAAHTPVEVVTQSLGEMFHFRLQHPVTVKRNQSALVPIVGKPIIPYAVDLAVRVESQQQRRHESVHQVKAVNGELSLFSAELESQTYTFDNNDERAKIVWLEHPLRSGWELYDTPTETERSPSHYRFRLELGAHEVREFKVVLKRIQRQSVTITGLNLQQLGYYRSGGYFSREAEPIVDQLMGLFRERNTLLQEIQENDKRSKECQAEVERCRKHLPSLGTSEEEGKLRSKYVASMDENENEIKQLRTRLQQLRVQSEEQWNRILTEVKNIEFEKSL